MYQVIHLLCVLISLLFSTVNGSNSAEISLTTASSRKSTSPKPTTLHKRINVETYNYKTFSSSTLLDLIEYVEARRKKGSKSSYTWKGDHYCHLQPRKGDCKETLNRFYYDARNDVCKPFVYTGCYGNKNNFETIADCERGCKGAINTQVQGLEHPAFCFLQPDKGLCLALFTKLYYDMNDKTCKEFIYGGCGGNQNNFDDKSSCMKTCSSFV